MSVTRKLKLLVGGMGPQPGERGPAAGSGWADFLDRSRWVAGAIFIVTVCAIALISSVGVRLLDLPVTPNQLAPARIVAGLPFSYVSQERSRIERERFLSRVPPVYRLEEAPLRRFETAARTLLRELAAWEAAHPASAPSLLARPAQLAPIAEAFNAQGPYELSPEDAALLLTAGDANARAALFETGFGALQEVYNQGIHDSTLAGAGPDGMTVFQVERPTGGVAARPVQSLEDALTFLRVSLAADNVPRATVNALFRFFRNGVTPNLVFDRDATSRLERESLSTLKPVVVNVPRGQTILEAGARVTPEQYEMFIAHRQRMTEAGGAEPDEGFELFGRVLLVLAMVLASLIYIRLEDPETLRSNVRLALLALVVIVNLALVRGVYSAGGAERFLRASPWASALPYLAPTALAPLIVAILIDAGSAIFMALLISIFTGVIYGNRLDLLVLTFLASLVAIFVCRDARRRGRVVSAAGAGGLTVAAFAALIGIANQTPADALAWQMGAGLTTGLVTGVAVVGLLPILESLFNRTTDITLLELTDYNHPLLRRMQLEAPGTYHHSIVVAQLSENACNAIGANPLLARVCALFHDAGKIANPLFFTENQRTGNPHDGKDPLESARIIRQHVADGVELAQRHHLPRAVIDVIRQHHGTTLVRYFYDRALGQARPPAGGGGPRLRDADYRYEGPRPRFKESAVIALADGVEAATRSMRSLTAEHLGPWIDRFVAERMADGQLDEAPLTLDDLTQVKHSFTFTLLNMLHGRVSYAESGGKLGEANA
jgi:putative nucleotidyltransferase with HDIG domain